MAKDDPSNRGQQLRRIRRLLANLEVGRKEYDFQLPTLVSPVDDYAGQPERLRKYAAGVINARIMQLLAVTMMKTYHFLECYVHGLEVGNPFAILMSARSQMEIFAVTWDVVGVIKENAGSQDADFVARVKVVDHALISATYGTRAGIVKEVLRSVPGASRLRPVRDDDLDVFKARNIQTRIDRLDKRGVFPGFTDIYERLCEYLHPNVGQNIILCVPSPKVQGLTRVERHSREALSRAIGASAFAMAESAERSVGAFDDLEPPFGAGRLVVPDV